MSAIRSTSESITCMNAMNAGNQEVCMPNPYVGRSDLIFCNRSETPEQNLVSLFVVITVAM